ncbi:MAG: winged helix-turn-helix transcriptional regulator [Promethearchaeota archaeon]
MKNLNDMIFNPENFGELIELIPKIEEAYLLGLERERKKYYQLGEKKDLDMKITMPPVNFFSKKWTPYILFALSLLKNPFFNDLKKELSEISTRTLTSRLKILTKIGIVDRTIHNTRPVRVSYSLTPYGARFISLHVPLTLYLKKLRLKDNILEVVNEE